jgi:molybdenum cofactor guanylyltransferase
MLKTNQARTGANPALTTKRHAQMTIAVILAGGLARRMGGGDKGLKPLAGISLLQRVIDRIGPQVDRLIINANGDTERFADFGLPVISDDLPDFPGPLAGILAGLDYAAEMTAARHVLSVAADCPFLPRDLMIGLQIRLERESVRIAVAHSGGFAQPTIALWDVSLRHDLRAALTGGERKIDRFTARYPVASVEWAATPVDPFFNVNTTDDMTMAELLLARYPEA